MAPIPLPFVDPTPLLQMVIGLISESLRQSALGFDWVLEYYFLWTGNFHGAANCFMAYGRPDCAFTGNEVLRGLYRLVAVIADTFLVAIVTYSFLRSIFERSFRARYTLKAILPRLLLVIVMVNFGLALMQGAIDVNNGVVHAIWTYRPGLDPSASNLWGGESPDGHRRSCDASWHSWSPPWERGQRENRDVDVVLTFLLPKQDRYHSQESVKMIQDRPAG